MADYDLSINVMMVGGRRCGKTSVLASMQQCFAQTQVNTPLVIRCANDKMLDVIGEKQQEMKRYFVMKGKNRLFVPNDSWDSEMSSYPFIIGIKGKASRICVNFVDYPGEWLKTERDRVKKELNKSRILLVAIDTPHLMEEDGVYNDARNRCWLVSELVKEAGFADASQGPGMILFVPLKCERYYNEGKMNEVNSKVQEAYKDLITYIRQPGADGTASRVTMAVTPILTFGGAEFSRFRLGETGDIIMDEKYGTPMEVLYWFPDMSKNAPEPKYCEQPLLYVLAYALELAKKAKEAKETVNIFDVFNMANVFVNWVQTMWFNWPSADDYLQQMKTINRQLKKSGDGYSILNRGILKL